MKKKKKHNYHYESEDSQDDLMSRLNKKIDDEVGADEYLAFTNPKKYMKKQLNKRKRRKDEYR